ncbi:uncharacterized protein LOC141942327 isoform X2 [Strix uralensis]|uniref:uncharacterized protein LOC141942327 isoform X2 n=1 Tax=Strix uralensis TaxID=36305 RepID=UPI003DA6F9BF
MMPPSPVTSVTGRGWAEPSAPFPGPGPGAAPVPPAMAVPATEGPCSAAAEEEEDGDEELLGAGGPRTWTPQEKLLHEARLKAKAKRRLRRASSRDSTRESLSEGAEPGPEPGSPKGRAHDRRSRTGKGRGLPKKGGAGGKGVWGAPGVVYGYQEPDARDPNYDEVAQGDTVYATVVPELEEGELEKNVQPMVLEYFEHGDTSEVMELLRGLNLGSRGHAVPSLAVALALEGKASHRELTSRLLSDLVGRVVTPEDIAWAFDKMLRDLPDLILDTPEAPQLLGQFIARAVADHALPLDFLERYKGRVDCEHARAALDRAAVLLRIKRDVNRLDNVWGVGGGQRPVKHLVKERRVPAPPPQLPLSPDEPAAARVPALRGGGGGRALSAGAGGAPLPPRAGLRGGGDGAGRLRGGTRGQDGDAAEGAVGDGAGDVGPDEPGLPAGVRGAGGHQPGRAAGPRPPGAAGGALLRPRRHHQGAAGRLPRQGPEALRERGRWGTGQAVSGAIPGRCRPCTRLGAGVARDVLSPPASPGGAGAPPCQPLPCTWDPCPAVGPTGGTIKRLPRAS